MSPSSTASGVSNAAQVTVEDTPLSRLCTECELPIPENRLKAQPKAQQCVPCLEKMGDVPTIKRFDEYRPTGERVETMFTENPRIEQQLQRFNTLVPPDQSFEIALSDDSLLRRDGSYGLDVPAHVEDIASEQMAAAMYEDDVEEDLETPCLAREDGTHCNCWYDGQACCACGDEGVHVDIQEPTT